MLTAHDISGSVVSSLDAIDGQFDLRDKFPFGSVTCPDCGCALVAKHGMIMVPHFAHKPEDGCTPLEPKPESQEHLFAKIKVREYLMHRYPKARVVLERRFLEQKRIADVCVLLDNGHFEVHEIQLSTITVEEIELRTTDYENAGASSVVWWLGESRATPSIRQFVARRCGVFGELEFGTSRHQKFQPIKDAA